MAAPPENKESNTFSVTIDDWESIQDEFLSPIFRINGYPWRLHISRERRTEDSSLHFFSLFLICDKSSEAELWKCTADITMTWPVGEVQHYQQTLSSWDEDKVRLRRCFSVLVRPFDLRFPVAPKRFQFEITTKEDGNSWRLCHIVNFCMYDCILVCGEKKKKIHVNKKSLASQSPFFDRLFYGDFREKNMTEIPIGDVEGEEFFNIIKLFYRFDGGYVSDQNVDRVLQLADRFELKIVEDRAISYLLSSSSPLSIVDTEYIADQYNLFFLKDNLLMECTRKKVMSLLISAEFDQLSHDSYRVLLNRTGIFQFDSYHMNLHTSHISVSNTTRNTNGSNTISMVILKLGYKREQYSSVYRINGFPWRLRYVNRGYYDKEIYVICDKSNEADLWKCTATISFNSFVPRTCTHTFSRWKQEQYIYTDRKVRVGSFLEVTITTNDDGDSYCRRPSFDPLEQRDRTILFEETEKKIEVNKKSLASQSTYFRNLFFCNSKKKKMKEILIRDVKYEEFSSIMALFYGGCDDNSSLNCNNAERMLQLAVRFKLKIVEDSVVYFLLSTPSYVLSLSKKLLIADHFNHSFLMVVLFTQLKSLYQLKELSESPEFNQLSMETIRMLFKFCV